VYKEENMYTKEEIVEKVREIATEMEAKDKRIKDLSASILVDRGRLEELKNLYSMIVAKEEELAEKEAKPKKKAPPKKRAKK
jgi:hypothetical protein